MPRPPACAMWVPPYHINTISAQRRELHPELAEQQVPERRLGVRLPVPAEVIPLHLPELFVVQVEAAGRQGTSHDADDTDRPHGAGRVVDVPDCQPPGASHGTQLEEELLLTVVVGTRHLLTELLADVLGRQAELDEVLFLLERPEGNRREDHTSDDAVVGPGQPPEGAKQTDEVHLVGEGVDALADVGDAVTPERVRPARGTVGQVELARHRTVESIKQCQQRRPAQPPQGRTGLAMHGVDGELGNHVRRRDHPADAHQVGGLPEQGTQAHEAHEPLQPPQQGDGSDDVKEPTEAGLDTTTQSLRLGVVGVHGKPPRPGLGSHNNIGKSQYIQVHHW